MTYTICLRTPWSHRWSRTSEIGRVHKKNKNTPKRVPVSKKISSSINVPINFAGQSPLSNRSEIPGELKHKSLWMLLMSPKYTHQRRLLRSYLQIWSVLFIPKESKMWPSCVQGMLLAWHWRPSGCAGSNISSHKLARKKHLSTVHRKYWSVKDRL